MKCTCKKDLEAKLTERFILAEAKATGHKAEFQGYGFVMTDTSLVLRGFMPIKLTAEHTSKAGAKRVKSTTQNMFFSFCPFCGVKI